MDQIEAFLETLFGNSPSQYKSVAQKALDIYQGRGALTVRLKDWAMRAAKAQRVAVPEAFDDVPVFEPKTRTYTPGDVPAQTEARARTPAPTSRPEDREVLAETMAAMAQLLAAAAEHLRRP